MPRRRGEGRETGADGLEPVELEPFDLEPVDPEPIAVEFDPASARARAHADRRRRAAWIAAAVAALIAFAAVAAVGNRNRGRARAESPATSTPPGTDTVDPVRALVLHLGRYWPGGEAIVMDGRLYVARARDARPELVVPELPAVIEEQSGSSLLISTFPELLVATEPNIASHVLSPRTVAIAAREPDEWWILHDDGTIRDTITGNVLRPPAGLRIAAEVDHGFIALDVPHDRWVVWRGDPVMPRLVNSRAQLIGAQGSIAVFRSGCTINGCALEIFDLAHRSAIDGYLPGVPDFAAFSPTGSRLALASTLGDVFLVDPADGAVIARTRSRVLPSLSSPIAWSTDGQHLIVVQQDSVEVRNATDGAVADVVTGTAGLEQLAGLP